MALIHTKLYASWSLVILSINEGLTDPLTSPTRPPISGAALQAFLARYEFD